MRSSPASPNIWSSASPPVSDVVAGAAEQEVGAALAEQRVVAGLAEQHVAAGAAGQRVVAGAAEQVGARAARRSLSLSVMVSLPPWPNTWIRLVFATVGVPPMTGTAPPLTRMLPAALRLIVTRVVEVVAEHRQRAGARRKACCNCHCRSLLKLRRGGWKRWRGLSGGCCRRLVAGSVCR